ncbi:hypothetical protein E2P81_ATG01981 [Venturia nashicola]|nr:hypothetical protein E2P81_ATG01981 [Venturia nashicola]
MLFKSLLLFAFTSLSIAVAIPPAVNEESMRKEAAAACDNLCNQTIQNKNKCIQCVMNTIANLACPAFDTRRVGQNGCGHVEQSSMPRLAGPPR